MVDRNAGSTKSRGETVWMLSDWFDGSFKAESGDPFPSGLGYVVQGAMWPRTYKDSETLSIQYIDNAHLAWTMVAYAAVGDTATSSVKSESHASKERLRALISIIRFNQLNFGPDARVLKP